MINELVSYCREQYFATTEGLPCDNKQYHLCPECLREIHYAKKLARVYDCPNMCYWYVCQDIYRYVTEMAWMFHDTRLGLMNRKDPLRICSIGCGPCSELIAFEEYYKRQNLSFDYSFTGFDRNFIWSDIQKQVKKLSMKPDNISFHNTDMFNYYTCLDNPKPNVIILNYVISDMLKYDYDAFIRFKDDLIHFIQELPSCALLINDINLGVCNKDPRSHYADFYRGVKNGINNDSQTIDVGTSHFKNSLKPYIYYGVERKNNLWLDAPDDIKQLFNTNTECHSAQILIVKRNKKSL